MDCAVDDPNFLMEAFLEVSSKQGGKDPVVDVCLDDYHLTSQKLEAFSVQEGCAVRNVQLCRKLAILLINDEGKVDVKRLDIALETLEKYLYQLGPLRQYDTIRRYQIIQALARLKRNPKLTQLLEHMDRPHQHPFLDEIIRQTLDLESHHVVTHVDTRRAVLSAWMCTLRQNVGSCFATAPAIIVHDEQPMQFLIDVAEIFSTGRLKRVFGGVEHAVPVSTSWGAGDIKRQEVFSLETIEPIWHQPGIESAMDAMKLDQQKERINRVLKRGNQGASAILLSAELLIDALLRDELKLSHKELEEFQKLPLPLRPTPLNIVPQTEKQRGKQHQCERYFLLKEQGESAFKRLADNALLKCWEFTLASFAETQAQFAKWNLYSSLGLAAEDKGGIGECLYQILKQKVEECTAKVHSLQEEYEALFTQVKFLERRLGRADSEQQARWMRGEYQSKVHEFHTVEEMRNRTHRKGEKFARLFNDLISLYVDLFPKYFQEVYDADMHDTAAGPYDDSPAGFRLVYKHGRINTSQWTPIEDQNQFVDALISFFIATEVEISGAPEFQGVEEDISEIVTAVVTHIKTKEFLESALFRMAKAHKAPLPKNPLDHLDQVQKKPWVYTSGGTMGTLVSHYFCREEPPTDVSRWVETPMELLVFIVDSIKERATKLQNSVDINRYKSLLMHSPTHAFLLKPGFDSFREAWEEKHVYTYTWVRDRFFTPGVNFVKHLLLTEEERDHLVGSLSKLLPNGVQKYFKKMLGGQRGRLGCAEFRDEIVATMIRDPNLQLGGHSLLTREDVDHILHSHLPLISRHELEERVRKVLEKLPGVVVKEVLELLETLPRQSHPEIISALQLQEICQGLLCLHLETQWVDEDYPLLITRACQELGYAIPRPLIFADTNWMKDLFGFVVNPATYELELWRLDPTGRSGYPMHIWAEWLNGSKKEPTWGIYVNPFEYTS